VAAFPRVNSPRTSALHLRGGGKPPKGKKGETKARAERIAAREAAQDVFKQDVGRGRKLKDDEDGLVSKWMQDDPLRRTDEDFSGVYSADKSSSSLANRMYILNFSHTCMAFPI